MLYPAIQMQKLGEDAVIRSWTEGAADAHGDPTWTSADADVKVIRSFVTNTRVPYRRSNELGESRVMDYEFFALSSVTVPEPHQERPPHLIHDGKTYRILDIEDSKIGLQRLIVELQRVK
jgi:hypothetical protein